MSDNWGPLQLNIITLYSPSPTPRNSRLSLRLSILYDYIKALIIYRHVRESVIYVFTVESPGSSST